jgi:hypothetical protein
MCVVLMYVCSYHYSLSSFVSKFVYLYICGTLGVYYYWVLASMSVDMDGSLSWMVQHPHLPT